MSEYAIAVENLCKRYNHVVAVDHLSFTVRTGGIFGLIGPDGAGKTTTMRILCALIRPDAGRCQIQGLEVTQQARRVKALIGYMPQRFALYPDLTVAENLRFFADLFLVPKSERERRYRQLLQFSRLEPFQKRKAAELSGGMKQKLALCCTLIHTPEVLILDEPTTGVDPVSRHEFWSILTELKRQGVTILISTPYMDEAARCDQVAFVHEGRVLIQDQPKKLLQLFPHPLLELRCQPLIPTAHKLKSLAGIIRVQVLGDRLRLTVKDTRQMQSVIQEYLLSVGTTIDNLQPVAPDIEDVFIELMAQHV